MLEELNNFIEQQNKIGDIIIAGDLNEDIESKNVKQFFIKRGLFNIHSIVNAEYNEARESIYLYGLRCIDTITTTIGLL